MSGRERAGLLLLRLTVAGILGAHGIHRATLGSVEGFGQFLSGRGLPQGLAIAWAITVGEMAGALLLATGRFVWLAVAFHVAVLGCGIWMVHGPEGWFVVGSGRNGMEFSVLLVAALLAIGLTHSRR